ncbi:PH domain-containing protein [Streptomyces castrisilvae]|uniref:PH domain-containing protein n=1 Tax=Streptomyces castrisilvae TaxID=3033811 RepID=A0ABY9HGV2_9ACTN|nr:PH domain-containing protein [Streptomyces sp. Mut1]WLQ33594.1 PH domain-containing protein [Streptomyces sp. Mut1]
MDDQGGDSVSVWRIGGPALVVGYAIPTVVGVSALTSWAGWVSSPGVDAARTAGLWTGLTAGIALFLWWAVLRVRLEVGPAGIVAVNPWGTHRLALNEVASVRLGAWGAEFHHGDGFKTTAYALSEMAAGTSQDQRFAELLAVLQSNPDFAPRA